MGTSLVSQGSPIGAWVARAGGLQLTQISRRLHDGGVPSALVPHPARFNLGPRLAPDGRVRRDRQRLRAAGMVKDMSYTLLVSLPYKNEEIMAFTTCATLARPACPLLHHWPGPPPVALPPHRFLELSPACDNCCWPG